MAHALKPNFVFRRNGRVHLNRRWRQFSRLLAAEVCASAVVMLDTSYSEVVWRVLATHSICQFPPFFPSLASRCAITFQLDSTTVQAPEDITLRRMRFACWITKATGTYSEYVILITSPGQKKFLSCDRSTGSCICLRLDVYMSHVLVLCVSVIFYTCDMYTSSLRHIWSGTSITR